MLLDFEALAGPLPEGFLLLSGDGRIAAANAAAAQALGAAREALIGRALAEICHLQGEEPLRAWARSTSPVPGAMALREPPHTRFRCRANALATPGGRLVMVRFSPVDANDRFLLLGQKIEELNREIIRRQEAKAALEQSETQLRLAVGALTRLHAISRKVADLRTPREVAEVVVREAILHTGAGCAAAYLADEDGSLQLLSSGGRASGTVPVTGSISGAEQGPVAEALRTRSALYLEDLPRPASDPRAAAALPLVLAGRALGVLTLDFSEARSFDASEREFLAALAQTFAQSLGRARLLESEQRSRRAAERYADRIQRLLRITAALAQALSPDDVAGAVIDEAARATDATSGGLWLIDRERGTLELVRSLGFAGDARRSYSRIPLDGSRQLPVVSAVRDREAMFIETDDELARWPGAAVPAASVAVHGPIAVVPLIVQGRPVGVVAYRFRRGRHIDDDERAVMMMVARYAAQALERARLYDSERRARQEAEASETRALEADRRKDEFLAMLGHELRNPLAPILTALQLMRLKGAQGNERERGVIERQVQHLVRLVDDLLDVSRITRGRVQLRQEPLDLKSVIARAVEIAAPLLEARAHRLDVRVPPQPLLVNGDGARLAQAFSNVLNNAAKYTEPGGQIFVHAGREGSEVAVRVRDTGIGIGPQMLPQVFDLFVQDQRGLDRSQGGLGVGLTIVRSLIELHGGKVSASSEGEGRGSEFEIRLPALDEAPAEARGAGTGPAPRPGEGTGARVLIVDDNVDAACVLAEALRHVGYDTAVAHDGVRGLEAVRSFRPGVVLLDIGLPVMDGYQVAARLRAESGGAPALVAISGYGQHADRARAKMAGFDEHLVKPVELDQVLEVVDRLSRSPAPQAAS